MKCCNSPSFMPIGSSKELNRVTIHFRRSCRKPLQIWMIWQEGPRCSQHETWRLCSCCDDGCSDQWLMMVCPFRIRLTVQLVRLVKGDVFIRCCDDEVHRFPDCPGPFSTLFFGGSSLCRFACYRSTKGGHPEGGQMEQGEGNISAGHKPENTCMYATLLVTLMISMKETLFLGFDTILSDVCFFSSWDS